MDKSIFNFKVQYKDGSIVDMQDDKNLWVSTFHILSPSPEHITETITGRHGVVKRGTILKERKIKSKIQIEAADELDFDLFRDEIFRIFNPLEEFYIIRDLQPGKRMKVSLAAEFDITYESLQDGEFDVDFVIHSSFLESVGSTPDPLTFDSEKWQIGQGLEANDLIYVHSGPSFRIFNAGDVPLDPHPVLMPLKMIFSGASTNLSIKNITTGDEWKYNGNTVPTDIVFLDSVKSYKNGISIFGNTNRKIISLAPGWNDFVISGAGEFQISFDFRFYYF